MRPPFAATRWWSQAIIRPVMPGSRNYRGVGRCRRTRGVWKIHVAHPRCHGVQRDTRAEESRAASNRAGRLALYSFLPFRGTPATLARPRRIEVFERGWRRLRRRLPVPPSRLCQSSLARVILCFPRGKQGGLWGCEDPRSVAFVRAGAWCERALGQSDVGRRFNLLLLEGLFLLCLAVSGGF